MKATQVTMNDINASRRRGYTIYGIKKAFCDLVSSCEECDKKIRKKCIKMKKIERKQIKRIIYIAKLNELNEVTENQVKETVKCAECKYLTLVNQKDCYAMCEKTKQKFLPFGVDTREYTCKYAEKQNEVTENE